MESTYGTLATLYKYRYIEIPCRIHSYRYSFENLESTFIYSPWRKSQSALIFITPKRPTLISRYPQFKVSHKVWLQKFPRIDEGALYSLLDIFFRQTVLSGVKIPTQNSNPTFTTRLSIQAPCYFRVWNSADVTTTVSWSRATTTVFGHGLAKKIAGGWLDEQAFIALLFGAYFIMLLVMLAC